MNLPRFSVRRPITIIMIILIFVLIGAVSLSKLKLDLLPNMNVPIAVVTAKYSGAGPKEVENNITKTFEQVLTTVPDLNSIETISISEYSLCILSFNNNTDMNFATLTIREKVDMAKAYLPKEVTDIMIMRVDPNNFQSTIELGISSDMSISELTRIVEDQIINKLERINGVAQVTVSGGLTQQIRIELIPESLSLYGINESILSQYLAAENLNIPAGSIEQSGLSIFLRTKGKFESIDQIKNLPVPTAFGTTVLLQDIAKVSLSEKERLSESYINGKLSINLSIQKQSNANTIFVCRALQNEIKNLGRTWPDIHFDILYDASTYIINSLKTVVDSVIKGGILAAVILYLFLRSFRATLIIAVSMPVSIVTTFVLMYFSGITINLISLAGLALGVGMLVDNSIVVLENIYRYRLGGMESVKAAEIGTKEVMLAISAATFTTVVVFIPIIFVEGLTGQVFKEMGLTITFSLLSSLIIAITFIPMMASRILRKDNIERTNQKKQTGAKIFNCWERFFENVSRWYTQLLKGCINNKGITVLISVMLFAISLITLKLVGFEYFPAMDEGIIEIEVFLPKGSKINETRQIAFTIKERIDKIPEVKDIIINLGNDGSVLNRAGTENAILSVNVGSVDERERGVTQISEDIIDEISDISGARIKIVDDSKVMGFSVAEDEVEVLVTGEEIDVLSEISDDIVSILEEIPGLRDIENSLQQKIEEVSIKIDRYKAAMYGLNTAQIGQSIQAKVEGVTVTRYDYHGSEIDVVVSLLNQTTQNLKDIRNLSILSPRGVSVPLSELANITLERSPSDIIRYDQKRTVSITADLSERVLNEVTDDIDKALANYTFPQGYEFFYGGQQEDLSSSFAELTDALILALAIVYMLLAAQFESLLHPVTIMLTVPLTLTGALFSLLITGNNLSVPAFIGIIMLVGIVVNNAIVLINTVNQYREDGLERDKAIITAGPLRLRPILMTTLTTILGMLPMALDKSEGSEILVPLAVVVIGGLTISTFVTLLFIPSFYVVFDEIINRVRRMR